MVVFHVFGTFILFVFVLFFFNYGCDPPLPSPSSDPLIMLCEQLQTGCISSGSALAEPRSDRFHTGLLSPGVGVTDLGGSVADGRTRTFQLDLAVTST